jgi:hypothetical protein
MALWQSSSRLVWDGAGTIWQITGNLERRQRTVLRLPTSYHPALSACLYTGVPVRKRIDLFGDAGLLVRIAEIDGLDELGRLVEPMRNMRARLRLRSPAPHLVFNVPPRRRVSYVGTGPQLQYGESWAARPAPATRRCPIAPDSTRCATEEGRAVVDSEHSRTPLF